MQLVDEEPAEGDLHGHRDAGADEQFVHGALHLEELDERRQKHVAEQAGQQPHHVRLRRARELRVLADRQQDLAHGQPHEADGHGGDGEDEERALQVDAQHVVLLRAIRLAAQRLQRVRESYLWVD